MIRENDNPYQAPSQFSHKVSPRTSLTEDEEKFILASKVLAVMVGVVAAPGAGLITWVATTWPSSLNMPFQAEAILGSGIIAGVAVGYFQLRRVESYRQRLLQSDSHKSRKEMMKIVSDAKTATRENADRL